MRRDVFQALADPIRRDIISLLADEHLSVNAVAEHFDISRPAISKHLKILKECGLIQTRKEGRTQLCEIQPRSLLPAFMWLEQYKKLWETKIDSFENYINEIQSKTKDHE